jgi:hypothetical protein
MIQFHLALQKWDSVWVFKVACWLPFTSLFTDLLNVQFNLFLIRVGSILSSPRAYWTTKVSHMLTLPLCNTLFNFSQKLLGSSGINVLRCSKINQPLTIPVTKEEETVRYPDLGAGPQVLFESIVWSSAIKCIALQVANPQHSLLYLNVVWLPPA